MENENAPNIAEPEQGTAVEESPGAKKKKHRKRNTILFVSIFALLGAGGGIGAGLILRSMLKPALTVVVENDSTRAIAEAKKPNLVEIRSKYDSAKAKGGNFATALTPAEAFNVPFLLLAEHTHTKATGVGESVAMGMGQVIQSTAIRDEDVYFEESNSMGVVSIYDRMVQEGDTTTTYWGSNSDYASHEPKTYTNEEYAAMMGRQVSQALVYVVSDKTALPTSENGDDPTGIVKTDTGYVIDVELDPTWAVTNYVKQMKTISDLATKPKFSYCHVKVITDENLEIKRFETHESYFAMTSFGVGSTCEGRLNTVYEVDGDYEIPDLTTKIEYPSSL